MLDSLLSTVKRMLPPAARCQLRAWGVKLFPHLRYPWWIRGRVRERREEFALASSTVNAAHIPPELFSLLTPVYDTEPRFLRELADSVLGQDYPWFEWVIVSNGTRRSDTQALLGRIAADKRVRLLRLDSNRGIVSGTKFALEHARGRYVVPIDHDDRLYPDALRVLAYYLQQHGFPAAAYSDEDKLLPSGRPWQAFCKPDWDPLLLLNCCYPAHLATFSRQVAGDLGFYADETVEGCQDWDAFLRLARAGFRPLHVPEVLYSWRMHAGSTANVHAGAKPYTIDRQYRLLQHHLDRLGRSDRLTVRTNSRFRREGMWRVIRRPVAPTPPIHVFEVGCICDDFGRSTYPDLRMQSVDQSDFSDALATLRPQDLVAVMQEEMQILSTDWAWEALGLFELFDDLVIVGGRLLDARGRVRSAGEVFGMGGPTGSPCRGWSAATPRRHGMLLCQRTVSAVHGSFFLARAGFLAEALAELTRDTSDLAGRTQARTLVPTELGAWLGVAARRRGLRLAYTPHIVAQAVRDRSPARSDEETWQFLEHHWATLLDDPYYSRFCSLRPGHGWQLTSPQERAAVLNYTLSQLAGPHPYLAEVKVDGSTNRKKPGECGVSADNP